ncbi:hypothetical protein [Hymenobacter sp. CRA2]|uniref:hypothetical protein n=1 Tax=Hymenobacter sp. CRA2 TaxID=1955620 RepID=UPI00098F578A|nr:hypothetical protein [Hymenobacter sp. CRA2]OON70878.1 hypothetical protein B0919_02405 [Hymenobacter sp. CRA2]
MEFDILLRRLKIVQDTTLHLPIEKELFVARLAAVTEQGYSSPLFSAVHALRSSGKEFTGDVGPDYFTIRRKASFSNPGLSAVTIRGTLLPADTGCAVELELDGFHLLYRMAYSLLALLYLFMLIYAVTSQPMLLAALLLHIAIIGVMPYISMRRSVSKMKHNIERELFFLTKTTA